MSVGDRLRTLIVSGLRINISTFSQAIGYDSPVTISRIINGVTTKPGIDVFQRIKEIYPQVNLSWLLTGEGEMMRSPERSLMEPVDLSHLVDELRAHNNLMQELVKILNEK